MRKFTAIIFILFVQSTVGQNIKNILEGNWICYRVADSLNIETEGLSGKSGEYLKFYFKKPFLRIIKSPFDRNVDIFYEFYKKDSIIDLYPNLQYSLAESKMKIQHLSKDEIVLRTRTTKNKMISYIFKKQESFIPNMKDSLTTDCGTILIIHLKTDYYDKNLSHESEYKIKMNSNLFYPTPQFDFNQYTTFGQYLSSNFSFPQDYTIGKTSSEMIIEFDVNQKGAENIAILKGIDETFDKKVLSIFEKSKKFWKPVFINNKTYFSRLKLHLYFYLGTTNS